MNRYAKLLVIGMSCCLVLFLMLGVVLGQDTDSEEPYRHLEVFTEVLSRIETEYVEEPDLKDVTLGALNGLLESIDPYASYLDAGQFAQYQESLRTAPADVGLALSRKVGYVSVVDAVPGSPADRAGIQTGDIVETINGVATRDMPLAYAEMLLRGEAGTSADLTILRVRQSAEPQEMHLTREKIVTPPVRADVIEGNIGLLRVRSVEDGVSEEVARQLRHLAQAGAERIILDLRRTATGQPAEGLAIADLFLDEGQMAYLEGQQTPRQDFRATRDNTVSRLPMVVVVNRGTARGGEVAAAALGENGRAKVVGERTYGDAGVRKAVVLNDGGAVILSVAKYHSPNGEALQDTGVTPDVATYASDPSAPLEEELFRIEPVPEPTVDKDEILQKAIEVLTGRAELAQRGDGTASPVTSPHGRESEGLMTPAEPIP